MTSTATVYPPGQLTLREVGLRDGLQLVKEWPDTNAKRNWLDAEYQAGVRHFEIGSFLPAKRFPQFADISDVIQHVVNLGASHGAALALNEQGAEDAICDDIDAIGTEGAHAWTRTIFHWLVARLAIERIEARRWTRASFRWLLARYA